MLLNLVYLGLLQRTCVGAGIPLVCPKHSPGICRLDSADGLGLGPAFRYVLIFGLGLLLWLLGGYLTGISMLHLLWAMGLKRGGTMPVVGHVGLG